MLVDPVGNERTIAHVGLLYLIAWFNAHQLCHESVEHVGVVLRLVCPAIGQQTEFNKLRIGNVIETEQVGTRLFYGISIGLQRIGAHTWQQLSAAVPQAFVQVGMKVITCVAIGKNHRTGGIVDDKLFHEATSSRCFRISFGDVLNGDTLRSMLSTNPVGIRQIDANGCRRILITTKHSCTDDVGRYTFDFLFLKSIINRRMILKPLRPLTNGLCALCAFFVAILHKSLPRAFQA